MMQQFESHSFKLIHHGLNIWHPHTLLVTAHVAILEAELLLIHGPRSMELEIPRIFEFLKGHRRFRNTLLCILLQRKSDEGARRLQNRIELELVNNVDTQHPTRGQPLIYIFENLRPLRHQVYREIIQRDQIELRRRCHRGDPHVPYLEMPCRKPCTRLLNHGFGSVISDDGMHVFAIKQLYMQSRAATEIRNTNISDGLPRGDHLLQRRLHFDSGPRIRLHKRIVYLRIKVIVTGIVDQGGGGIRKSFQGKIEAPRLGSPTLKEIQDTQHTYCKDYSEPPHVYLGWMEKKGAAGHTTPIKNPVIPAGMPPKTLCGYDLSDVRRSLKEAIGRRDKRAAHRWAAELVATPGAIGSLWSSFWLACETSADGNPTMPILLSQVWTEMVGIANRHAGDWAAFRNDEVVRRSVAEVTTRLLDYNRQAVFTWPSKEVALYDVSTTLEKVPAATADSPIVTAVWSRNHDAMELRQLAGHWVEALHRGDMRIALSIIMWTMLPTTKIQCGARGPPHNRNSPIWFWFSVGSSLLRTISAHPGWLTMHDVTVEAFTDHYKRWSSTERLKIILFWTMQIKAAMKRGTDLSMWSIAPIQLSVTDIDLPYKEIAVEFTSQEAPIEAATAVKAPVKAVKAVKESPETSKILDKMKAADEQILAMMGIN